MKMVWNLPFNGISVAMGGLTVDQIVQDDDLRKLSYQIMGETIAIANADLERLHGEGGYTPLGKAEMDAMMSLSDGMGPYRTSTMIDFVERRPMEVKYMFEKPVMIANSLGVDARHLETIVALIKAYQRMYNL